MSLNYQISDSCSANAGANVYKIKSENETDVTSKYQYWREKCSGTYISSLN